MKVGRRAPQGSNLGPSTGVQESVSRQRVIAVGRVAIAEIARGFMRDFPDMIVTFDKLELRGDLTAFHWTLSGTNTGPGGTGNRLRISGYELWKIDHVGFIAESTGHFDADEYERQLKHGVEPL